MYCPAWRLTPGTGAWSHSVGVHHWARPLELRRSSGQISPAPAGGSIDSSLDGISRTLVGRTGWQGYM